MMPSAATAMLGSTGGAIAFPPAALTPHSFAGFRQAAPLSNSSSGSVGTLINLPMRISGVGH